LLTRGNPRIHDQTWITIAFLLVGLFLARLMADSIISDSTTFLYEVAVGIVGFALVVLVLRNWRVGFAFFNVALICEDLVRKYQGNGPLFFFGKDAIAALTFIVLLFAIRRGKEPLFRPPFLLWFPFSLFAWLAALQIFNPHSPSILYGLLGFKLDFFYVPMVFVGYAVIRNWKDLRTFLIGNAVLAIVVSAAGIIQGVVGNTFLNPGDLPIELQVTATLEKTAPISGQSFSLPNSIFVSPGRLALYLMLAMILGIGTAGFLLVSNQRKRNIVFLSIGMVAAAAILSGTRTAVILVFSSTVAMVIGLLWGAPSRTRRAQRITRAVTASVGIIAVGLLLASVLYPSQVGSRVAFYAETLNPFSTASAVGYRGFSYPLLNFKIAFNDPNWFLGNGTGTASLGLQYVSRILRSPFMGTLIEEGYGQLMLEMGMLAPILWIIWATATVYCCWKVALRLKQTAAFPVAFAILWFVFLLLFPMTFGGLSAFQNYIDNAFLWLLIGILYRLPEIAAMPDVAEAEPRRGRGLRFWRPAPRMRREFQQQPDL
jgi:hypothetical protein